MPLDAVWGSADEVTAALFGTPFGPLVVALPAGQQRQVRDDLARRLGASADGVTVRTVSTSLAESSSARRRQGQPGKSSGRLAARCPCSRPVDWPTSIR